MNQSEFEVITCNRRQARENARVQLAIGFAFASHWLRKWREFWQPITQPRSQGPLSTSRKYPGYGWSRVYTCQLQTHRGWVLNKLQLQLQLSSPSLRSYLWNLLKSSRHVTSRNQGTFSSRERTLGTRLPITERSKAKPKQPRITFDTRLKTALNRTKQG